MAAQISSTIRTARTAALPSSPALKKIEYYGIINSTYQHPITSQIAISGKKKSNSLILVFHKSPKM